MSHTHNEENRGSEMELIAELLKWKEDDNKPEVLLDRGKDKESYNSHRKVFNTRFHLYPLAIILCETEQDVQATMDLANRYKWPLHVRSGGHDHEGFCSGDNVLAMDLRRMHEVKQDVTDRLILRVQPGIPFKNLVLKLAEMGVCIPHGTCGTVNVAGFTLGGGWGPWTRIQGMCIEHLVGARVVLNTGEAIEVNNTMTDQRSQDILWALRGGGGVACGIVTELIYKAFDMPPNTIKFNLVWQGKPALKVLEMWEAIIEPGKNERLIGTNLMISAVNPDDVSQDITKAEHDCTFFGYFAGTYGELKTALNEWFIDMPATQTNIPIGPIVGRLAGRGARATPVEIKNGVSDALFDEDLIRQVESHNETQRGLARRGGSNPVHNIQLADDDFSIFRTWDMPVKTTSVTTANGRTLDYIPPDTDTASPHKITSKVMKWIDTGDVAAQRHEARLNVIRSLQSKLIPGKSQSGDYNACNVQCYATLGSITGPYYSKHPDYPDAIGCSMPYRHNFYTVQYQAWWNNDCYPTGEWPLTWIDTCREYKFPQTEGAFISFRDKHVPYSTYFLHNYDRLKQIMEKYMI